MAKQQWESKIESTIHAYMAVSPETNEDIQTLASCIYLQKELPALFSFIPNEILVTESPDNKVNLILQKLSYDFTLYIDNKKECMEKSTDYSECCMSENLQQILQDIGNILNLLYSGVTNEKEKTTIQEFSVEIYNKLLK